MPRGWCCHLELRRGFMPPSFSAITTSPSFHPFLRRFVMSRPLPGPYQLMAEAQAFLGPCFPPCCNGYSPSAGHSSVCGVSWQYTPCSERCLLKSVSLCLVGCLLGPSLMAFSQTSHLIGGHALRITGGLLWSLTGGAFPSLTGGTFPFLNSGAPKPITGGSH